MKLIFGADKVFYKLIPSIFDDLMGVTCHAQSILNNYAILQEKNE